MLGKDQCTSIKLTGDKDTFTNLPRQIILGVGFSVFLVIILVYTPALKNDFINWDDPQCIYENFHIHSLDVKSLYWMISSFHAGNWHPLTWLSHALVYYFWGLNPTMHHFINIVLHAFNTLLVFFLVLSLLTRIKAIPINMFTYSLGTSISPQVIIAGSITALLFGLHPLNVESVAWVTERKGLLSTFFVLLSLLSYLTYTSSIHKKRRLIWFYIQGAVLQTFFSLHFYLTNKLVVVFLQLVYCLFLLY